MKESQKNRSTIINEAIEMYQRNQLEQDLKQAYLDDSDDQDMVKMAWNIMNEVLWK